MVTELSVCIRPFRLQQPCKSLRQPFCFCYRLFFLQCVCVKTYSRLSSHTWDNQLCASETSQLLQTEPAALMWLKKTGSRKLFLCVVSYSADMNVPGSSLKAALCTLLCVTGCYRIPSGTQHIQLRQRGELTAQLSRCFFYFPLTFCMFPLVYVQNVLIH